MTSLERPDTLGAAVVKHIRDAVLRGDYPPGGQLSEVTLAESLGVSRGTVREALRALAESSLVQIIPHRGAFIPKLTVRRAREIYSLRMILEPFAARLAFENGRIDAESIAEIRTAFAFLESAGASGDPGSVIDADMAFHERLSRLSNHEMLLELLATLQVQTRRFITYTKLFASDLTDEVQDHLPIMAALEAADSARLEEAVRDHIRQSGELLVDKMTTLGADD